MDNILCKNLMENTFSTVIIPTYTNSVLVFKKINNFQEKNMYNELTNVTLSFSFKKCRLY